MYTYPWYHWIAFFYLYCFFGWIFESTYVSLKEHHFVNRGFLRLPMLPLYGTGAVMMLWVSLPVKDNLFLVYLFGVIAATILEYVTGYVMERLFKMKYWDYSNQRFNINGYICLSSSIAWGFLTIFMTELIHRPIAEFVLGMSPIVEFCFLFIVSGLFAADVVKSTKEALDLGRALEAMTKLKAEAEEMQVQIALLKEEAALRAEEIRETAAVRMAGLKADTAAKVADLKVDAAVRIAELKTDATVKVAEFKTDAAVKMAELKTDAAVRIAEFQEEATTRAAGFMSDAAARAEQFHGEVSQKAMELSEHVSALASQKADEYEQREAALSDRLRTLKERRQKLTSHMSSYRKRILTGNPSFSSKRFSEALKELRDSLQL